MVADMAVMKKAKKVKLSKEMKELVCVLDEARSFVADRWCQNTFRDGENVCAMGAIIEAEGNPHGEPKETDPAILALSGSIRVRDTYPEDLPTERIARWNDVYNRRQRDVVKAFDRAIEGVATGKITAASLKKAAQKQETY
jgi:hypothetical protein